MRISDWSSDVCSSDLKLRQRRVACKLSPRHERPQVHDEGLFALKHHVFVLTPDQEELARIVLPQKGPHTRLIGQNVRVARLQHPEVIEGRQLQASGCGCEQQENERYPAATLVTPIPR